MIPMLVAWFIAFVVVAYVAVASVAVVVWLLNCWTESEERQQAAQRQRLDALMRLTDKPPAAAGLKHRRVS